MSAKTLLVPGIQVVKPSLGLPAAATSNLFVASGAILVTGLLGRVVTALGATATNLSLGTLATTVSSVASATPVTSKAAGSWILPTGIEPAALATPSPPSVPATGVAAQNVNTYPVSVVINANGATITNVSVNGVTVGTAAGTYAVPAFGSISIAYTVATPTWTWTNALSAGGAGPLLVNAAGFVVAQGNPNLPFMISPFLLAADTITWTTSAIDTGAITWYLWYVPIDASAAVS